jgi:hypothetical protein
LDKDVIENAKEYAKRQEISLSQLIENYLHAVTKKKPIEEKIRPLVKSLTGVMPSSSDDADRKSYYEYFEKIYARWKGFWWIPISYLTFSKVARLN